MENPSQITEKSSNEREISSLAETSEEHVAITVNKKIEEVRASLGDGKEFFNSSVFRLIEKPEGRGTIIAVIVDPGSRTGKTATRKGLRRFKALLETGEVPTTEGQPSGREEIGPTSH